VNDDENGVLFLEGLNKRFTTKNRNYGNKLKIIWVNQSGLDLSKVFDHIYDLLTHSSFRIQNSRLKNLKTTDILIVVDRFLICL